MAYRTTCFPFGFCLISTLVSYDSPVSQRSPAFSFSNTLASPAGDFCISFFCLEGFSLGFSMFYLLSSIGPKPLLRRSLLYRTYQKRPLSRAAVLFYLFV